MTSRSVKPTLPSESRDEISKRLRRIEGQLRGVTRMIDEEAACLDIAQQLSAARKALDSVYARMTVCYVEKVLAPATTKSNAQFERMMGDLETLLKRMG